MYFESAYEAIKKYKHIITWPKKLAYDYNEHLCYDYTVQEILVIKTDDFYQDAVEAEREVKRFTKNTRIVGVKEASKILREYQRKNK
jgi:hypothetical protein